jgi:hypothetical protein
MFCPECDAETALTSEGFEYCTECAHVIEPDDEPHDNCRTIQELHQEAWYEDRRW